MGGTRYPPRSSRVEVSLALEHGNEDPQHAVTHTSESATVTVAPRSQGVVLSATRWIDLGADPCAVVKRVAEAAVAAVAHDHVPASAALLGDRCDPSMSSQGVVVSISECLRGLGEHRGGHDSPNSWQGSDYSDVTMLCFLFLIAELLQERLDPRGAVRALPVHQAESG